MNQRENLAAIKALFTPPSNIDAESDAPEPTFTVVVNGGDPVTVPQTIAMLIVGNYESILKRVSDPRYRSLPETLATPVSINEIVLLFPDYVAERIGRNVAKLAGGEP